MAEVGGIIRINLSTKHVDGCDTNIIQIEDNGRGISKESLPHVFNPFYTTRSEDNHVGIGLTIARRLIHECGGEVYLSSNLDEGTVATVNMTPYTQVSRRELEELKAA